MNGPAQYGHHIWTLNTVYIYVIIAHNIAAINLKNYIKNLNHLHLSLAATKLLNLI